jgi:hypothetical protein
MRSTTTLADEIAELAAHLDSATQRLLTCIRAFDESGDWERQGAVSCAHPPIAASAPATPPAPMPRS